MKPITNLLSKAVASDTAVSDLWNLLRPKILRDAQSTIRGTDFDSPEGIADKAFRDAVVWLRDQDDVPDSTIFWAILSINLSQIGNDHRWEMINGSIDIEKQRIQFNENHKLELDEEVNSIKGIDPNIFEIIEMLSQNHNPHQIAKSLGWATNTTYVRIRHIRSELQKRLSKRELA